MAENIIKDFVKKQTMPLTIGVPKQKPIATNNFPEGVNNIQTDSTVDSVSGSEVSTVQTSLNTFKGHIGRPKCDVVKVKLSLYVPEDVKKKLIKIQHHNYRKSLNDVLFEAISDVLKKYDE